MDRKRGKAGETERETKKSKHSAAEESWQTLALSSETLRKWLKLSPTGSLGVDMETYYLSQVLQTGYVRMLAAQSLMTEFESDKFIWPTSPIEDASDQDKLVVIRFFLALADNDIGPFAFPADKKETVKELARSIFSVKMDDQHPLSQEHWQVAKEAFEGEEIVDGVGTPPSQRLQHVLMEYMDTYFGTARQKGDVAYHSPYASMVGPSGSGKTFSVKHMAENEGVWVVYASLSSSDRSIPPRGPLSACVLRLSSVQAATKFWTQYLRSCVWLVELAKENNMTPAMLFRLFYHDDFPLFREALATLVGGSKALGNADSICTKQSIAEALQATVDLEALRAWETSRATSRRPSADTYTQSKRIVVCLDEARSLLHVPADNIEGYSESRPIAFRQLLRVLAKNGMTTGHQLFGLLLDTSSRVQNFSPSVAHDPSIKIGEGTDLFAPLYGINTTWDGMAMRSEAVQNWLKTVLVRARANDPLSAAVHVGPRVDHDWSRFHYSLGRPLWGGIIEASMQGSSDNMAKKLTEGICVVGKLVHSKLKAKAAMTHTEQEHYHLALLMFRLQFHISDHKLSEACVADWLHYVRHVSEDRTTIQTVQPGEPVLVQYVADCMRKSSTLRESLVVSLANALHYGALNVGDAGELVVGLLLLLAADSLPSDKADPDALHMSLASLMKAFVGWQADDVPSMASARVYVTHIGRLCTGPSSITQRHLQIAFLTGEAWFLPANFRGADLLIPVWQGPGLPMTAVLVQVKNQQSPLGHSVKVQKEARQDIVAARSSIAALFDEALPVYGLFLNVRPLPSPSESLGSALTGTLRTVVASEPEDGNLFIFAQRGFEEDTYGFLTPREFQVLAGIVQAHPLGIAKDDPHNLKPLLYSRTGSTFIAYESSAIWQEVADMEV